MEGENAVRRIVAAAAVDGLTRLGDVLPLCEGADAWLVGRLLEEVAGAGRAAGPRRDAFRAAVADFIRALPAPNPAFAQWWFGIDTVEGVTAQMARDVAGRTALVLGAPSMAYGLALRGFRVTVLDADVDVVALLAGVTSRGGMALPAGSGGAVEARVFDAAGGEVADVVGGVAFDAVFTDPPWYRAWFGVFLEQARAVIAPGGHLYCSLLPRLARPGAADDRHDILGALGAAGFDIQAVARGGLGYTVPRLELESYSGLDDYGPGGWRHGDLIHARALRLDEQTAPAFGVLAGEGGVLPRHDVRVYRRQAERFRVFVRAVLPRRIAADAAMLVQPVAFQAGHSDDPLGPDLWSSDKHGVRLRDDHVAHVAGQLLSDWQEGLSRQQALDRVDGHPDAGEIVAALDAEMVLWGRFAGQPRDDGDAAPVLAVRAYPETEDPACGPFLVDRARIVGSAALRRQADKARLLPAAGGGPAPSQLMHSLDVMEVAGTIGRALGLNPGLIEAGGLAYGIGQPPFGAAGATGIHKVLSVALPELVFDPQAHGADLAGLLESSCHGARPGLNLTRGTLACIGGATVAGEGAAEAQVVRVAYRIAGLVADIEHGIALGAIRRDDLFRCRLFHRAPIDLFIDLGGTNELAGAFQRARGNVVRVLTEDAIEASAPRLAQAGLEGEGDRPAVDFSARIAADVAQVWRALQVGRVQGCVQVRLAQARASRGTATLVAACAMMPELVDAGFRARHARLGEWPEGQAYLGRYRGHAAGVEAASFVGALVRFCGPVAGLVGAGGVDVDALVLAKDYVASLRDREATRLLGSLLPVLDDLPEGLVHLA